MESEGESKSNIRSTIGIAVLVFVVFGLIMLILFLLGIFKNNEDSDSPTPAPISSETIQNKETWVPGARVKIEPDDSTKSNVEYHWEGPLTYSAWKDKIMTSEASDDTTITIEGKIKSDIQYLAIAVDDSVKELRLDDILVEEEKESMPSSFSSETITPYENYAYSKSGGGHRWHLYPINKKEGYLKIVLREEKDTMEFEIRYGSDKSTLSSWPILDSSQISVLEEDLPSLKWGDSIDILRDWMRFDYGYWSSNPFDSDYVKTEDGKKMVDLYVKDTPSTYPGAYFYFYDSRSNMKDYAPQLRERIRPNTTYMIKLTYEANWDGTDKFIRPYLCDNDERGINSNHYQSPDSSRKFNDTGNVNSTLSLVYKKLQKNAVSNLVWVFTTSNQFTPCGNISFHIASRSTISYGKDGETTVTDTCTQELIDANKTDCIVGDPITRSDSKDLKLKIYGIQFLRMPKTG